MDKILDFSWGDTRGIRKVILDVYKGLGAIQSMPLIDYGYPPYEGDPELVRLIRDLTKYLTKDDYKHIAITAGCTHAASAAFSALKSGGASAVATRSMYYPRYPMIIKEAGLAHAYWDSRTPGYSSQDIVVVESPSNPQGLVTIADFATKKVVWDAAYYTPTYGAVPGVNKVWDTKVYCGSLSKLTGINGIRVGWTATNDELVHNKIIDYIKSTVCGVSYPSQYVAKEILKNLESLEAFFFKSNLLISLNKEEVAKLRGIFGSDDIPLFGMFAFFEVDDAMLKLFDKAGVKFTSGADCGATNLSVRINLANSNEQTAEMVKRILKADRRKR